MAPKGYSRTQIALHWGVAALIIPVFVLHDPIVAASDAIKNAEVPVISALVTFHVIGGSLILALAIWRLALRKKRGVPALPEKESQLFKGLAHLTHYALYTLMIVLSVTGLAAWYGGSATADFLHVNMELLLLGFFALHIIGALYQQYVLKTGLINRMMRADD